MIFRETQRNNNELCMVIKTQIMENVEIGRYNYSKVMPLYKEMRIKQLWCLKKDLTNIYWDTYLSRKTTLWNPLERDQIKFNFDDFSKGNPGLVRASDIIRNHLGDYIAGYRKNVGIYSNNK